MNIDRHQRVKGLGLTAIVGSLALPITDVIAILLRPGYNPLATSVSHLALGSTGWIQEIGLYLGGIGAIACALGMGMVLSKQWEVRLGEIMIFLVGVGLILAATFHTDPYGHVSTLHGQIHAWASFASGVVVLPAFFLVSPGIRNSRPLFIYTIITGILQIVLEVGRGRLPSHWILFDSNYFLGNFGKTSE
jgi:hypothetical protein